MSKRRANLRVNWPAVVAATVFAAAFVLLSATESAAQCALCQTAVRAGGEQTARTMNTAIIVLLVPPVTIFCSIFAVVFKYRKSQGGGAGEGDDGRG